MRPRISVAAAALVALAACHVSPPALPEVKVFAGEGLPGDVVRDVAARMNVARVTLVPAVELAEVAWLPDPTAALALGPRAAPNSAPDVAGLNPRWLDPKGRFAPVGALARVLVYDPRAPLPVEPASLRHLVDSSAKGKIAIGHPGRGAGPVTYAALSLAYGKGAVDRFLARLAENAPLVLGSDAEVRAAVASGKAAIGFTGSLEGAAGAMSAAALQVVYPDQTGLGTPLLPTAVVLLPGAGEGPRRLAAWLVGRDAETVLVARAPGILPLRAEVPVPLGVRLAANVSAPQLDWDRLAAEVARLAPKLERWPEGFDAPAGLAAPTPRP